LFQQLERLISDSILGLMAKYRADPFDRKVDLGVGVYRDVSGNTPILDCVRRAEKEVLAAQTTKSYVGAAGREEFNSAVEEMVLGASHATRRDRRARTLQTPGGCGALRVGAELIKAAAPNVAVHLSDPTWGNHAPLLGGCGLKLERYPYYDAATHQLRFEAMLQRLESATPGDAVLIHACCHNPTGADLSPDQWQAVAQIMEDYENDDAIRVIVVSGARPEEQKEDPAALEAEVRLRLARGERPKEIAEALSTRHPKRAVYQLALKLKRED